MLANFSSLHKEICDYYEFVKPHNFEQVVRQELLERLQNFIQQKRPGCEVRPFGSFAAGLYLPNADMDLVLLSPEFMRSGIRTMGQTLPQMRNIAALLEHGGIADKSSVEIIAKAKVPLVKYVDKATNLRVDMSFDNITGILANDTFQQWKRQYPAMPILVTLIKQFLMMRGLNEVMHGGIGGFSVTCLVTSMLQNMPRVQTGELIPEAHLGEMLLEFLDLYGNRFDIARTGIEMNPPGYFAKVHETVMAKIILLTVLLLVRPLKV